MSQPRSPPMTDTPQPRDYYIVTNPLRHHDCERSTTVRTRLFLLALLILIPSAVIAWQVGNAQLDNIELHDDLRDIAAQNGVNIGLNSPKNDDQMRKEVIDTAAEHGLRLQPHEITLQQHTSPSVNDPAAGRIWYDIKVDYTVPINLSIYSFNLHFVQTSSKHE
jgi:hypothetical protein